MKKIVLFVFLFSITVGLSSSSAAQGEPEEEKPSYSTEQVGETPLEKILKNADEITYKNQDEIISIYNSDVFSYFKIYGYNTELKKNTFKKTAEYAEKLSELKKIKQEILQSNYYVTLNGEKLGDYNVKRKGFKIELGSNIRAGGYGGMRPSKSIEEVIFPSLPTENEAWKDIAGMRMPPGIFIEYYFLPLNEQKGLTAETNKNDIKIYLIFKIADVKKVSYKTFSAGGEVGWFQSTGNHIIAKSLRIVAADEKSGEIYFDKSYK